MRLIKSTLLSCIAVLIYVCLANSLVAQTNEVDSLESDSSFLGIFSEANFMYDTIILKKPVDYHLTQRYQIQKDFYPFLRVGNPGHALYSPIVSNMTEPLDITSSVQRPYLPYMDQRQNISYYRNSPPFTILSYMSGPREEEAIDVTHGRNIGKNMNLALHLDRNASVGFYNHLKTKSAHFNISFNYASSNNRYNALTHYYVNRMEYQENGGFADFNAIENPETIGSTRLNTAFNDIKDEGILLSQSFGFGNTAKKGATMIRPIVRIGHDIQYVKGYRNYIDRGDNGSLNTEFYSTIYFDSTISRDTISYEYLKNQLNLYLYAGEERIKLFYANNLVKYNQSQFLDTVYTDHTVGSEFSLFLFKRSYRSDIDAAYVFEGFRKGDLKANLNLQKRKMDTINAPSVLTSFYYSLTNPQFKELNYISNNFIWSNDFNKIQRTGFKVGLEYKGYYLYGDAGLVSNYIFYNDQIIPEQNLDRISYSSLGLNKLLSWRNIHLDNRIIYQNSSNASLPVPALMFQEGAYYENYMFKKVVLYRVGVDVNYFSGFNGLAYSPVIGEFHTQSESIVGNYPFIDIYFTFQLKRAFFFLKFEHFNKGMASNNFYQIPNYPVPPRGFKWGLKWTLFD